MFTYLLIYRRFTFKTETSVIYKLIKMLLALVVDASSPCGIQRAPELAPKAASRTLAMYALKRKIMTKATKRTVGKQRVCFFCVCFFYAQSSRAVTSGGRKEQTRSILVTVSK